MPVDMNKSEPSPSRRVEFHKVLPDVDEPRPRPVVPSSPATQPPPAPGAPFGPPLPGQQQTPYAGMPGASLGARARPPLYPPGQQQRAPYGPAGDLPSPRRSSRKVPLLVVTSVVVAVLAGLLVGLAVRRSGDSSGSQGLASRAVTANTPSLASAPAQASSEAGTSGQAISSPPATSTVVPAPTTRTPIDLVGPTQQYSAPGGLTVEGPAGWRLDRSAGVPNIRDYIDSSSPDRLVGGYFRIGIGNPTPSGSFTDEVDQAANFLRTTYDADIRHIAFTTFLGATPAADVEYSYVPDGHTVARHGVERLCRRDGHTLIVQASDLSGRWARTRAIFSRLVATASIN